MVPALVALLASGVGGVGFVVFVAIGVVDDERVVVIWAGSARSWGSE